MHSPAAGLLLVLVPAPSSLTLASVDVVTTADGAGADAFVSWFEPETNFGIIPAIRVKYTNPMPPHFDRKGYLRFDISGLARNPVESALELTFTEEFSGVPVSGLQQFSVYGLDDGVEEDWNESTLTWNNAPANDVTSGNGVTADARLLGGFTVDGTGAPGACVVMESPLLLQFVLDDTDGLLTLIVVRDTLDRDVGGWIHSFAPKEHPEYAGPRLTLTFVTCPADLDGSGSVDVVDLLAILAAWGTDAGDVTGDGTTDVADLLAVLSAWGKC